MEMSPFIYQTLTKNKKNRTTVISFGSSAILFEAISKSVMPVETGIQ
jgi:hypothetical protein